MLFIFIYYLYICIYKQSTFFYYIIYKGILPMLNRFIQPIVRKIHNRSAMAELNRLTDHQLEDIGLTRSDIRTFLK